MKTRKLIIGVLVSLLVFSLFINSESWASSQVDPIKTLDSCKVIKVVCTTIPPNTCCERWCCDSSDSRVANCSIIEGSLYCQPTSPQHGPIGGWIPK
jgi:hypothetical protein